MIVPTVTIVHPDDASTFCIINADEFDAKVMTLFDETPKPRRGRPPKVRD
jgi:hypothetical protein